MEIIYKILPLVVILLAYKWPRISLVLVCLLLQWWVAAIGVVLVSIVALVKINIRKMTKEEFEEYLKKEKNK